MRQLPPFDSWCLPGAFALALLTASGCPTGNPWGDDDDMTGNDDDATFGDDDDTAGDDDDTAGCEDECAPAGAEECYGNGIRTCGEYDGTDPCDEWSAAEPCDDGLVCDPESVTCVESDVDLPDPFSIVLLPDTQYYAEKLPDDPDNTYYLQTQWIVDHQAAEDIRAAVHLGDITDNNTPDEWAIASAAHATLDAAGIPYSVLPGNHDFLDDGDFGRGDTLMGDYFGEDRFAGQPWYGGAYSASNTNNYITFEVDELRFLVLSLEYAPRKDPLCWAEDVIAAHPDHRVIVATHCHQTHGGEYTSSCPKSDYTTTGRPPQAVWDELLARHSTIFLVAAGHVGDSEIRAKTGNTGHTVHEMLVDYQFEAGCDEALASSCTEHCRTGHYTGNGWLRLLTVDPVAGLIHASTLTVEDGNTDLFPGGQPVLYCSPLFDPGFPNPSGDDWYDQDPLDPDHHFDFPLLLGTPPVYTYDDLGLRAFHDRTVNSTASGDQDRPAIALSGDGSFVAAWEDDSSAADGADNLDVLIRGFVPGGCEGFSDLSADVDTTGDQREPALAADASGNFVVAWADDTDDNGRYQIRARGFAPDGSERIAEFTVNSVATGEQRDPAIAMAPDGRFAIAWEDDPENDGDSQILVRGFAADGVELFADRSVHDEDQGDRVNPAVGMDASGNIVVAWQDDGDGNGYDQIHARGFDASGDEWFPRVTVNSVSDGQQRNPAIGVDDAGGFVVAWQDDPGNDGDYDIMARSFAAGGSPQTEWTVASGGQRRDPALAMAPGGAFAISWEDDGDGNGMFQVKAASWTSGGAPWHAEATVNHESAGQQINPAVGLADDGTLVVLWADDMDGNDVGQILGAGFDAP